MKNKYERRNMAESLQQFSKRHALPLSFARPFWRREGMRLLGLPNGLKMGYASVTPGASINWKPEYRVEEEFE